METGTGTWGSLRDRQVHPGIDLLSMVPAWCFLWHSKLHVAFALCPCAMACGRHDNDLTWHCVLSWASHSHPGEHLGDLLFLPASPSHYRRMQDRHCRGQFAFCFLLLPCLLLPLPGPGGDRHIIILPTLPPLGNSLPPSPDLPHHNPSLPFLPSLPSPLPFSPTPGLDVR